jgi:hypothetical protein
MPQLDLSTGIVVYILGAAAFPKDLICGNND